MADRRQKLYDRYFTDEAQEREVTAIVQEEIEQLQNWSELVTRPGYRDFKNRLDALEANYDPKPDTPEAMLYTIGRRDGIRIVKRVLEGMEAEIKARRNDA